MIGNVTQVGLGLVPQNGGVTKTVGQISEALGGTRIISFSRKREIQMASNLRQSYATHWIIPSFPGFIHYGYAPRNNRTGERTIIDETRLFFCHVMLRHHAVWVKRVSERFGIPYIFIPHGQLDPYVYTYRGWIKRMWLDIYGRSFLKGASKVLFTTSRERDKASWFFSGNNSKVLFWPIEAPPSLDRNLCREELKAELHIDSDVTLFLYLGRLHKSKRPLETIKSFAVSSTNDMHLLIVGPEEGVRVKDCLELAIRCGVGNRVHVLGPRFGNCKYRTLAGSDAYVSLSFKENFNYTAAEALSIGLPVILSEGNDLIFDLKNKSFAASVKIGDEEALANSMSRIRQARSEDTNLMRIEAIDWACKYLSFDSFKSEMNNLVLSALAEKPRQRK